MAISKYYFDSFLTQLDNFIKERVNEEFERYVFDNVQDAPKPQDNSVKEEGKEWSSNVFDAPPVFDQPCDSCSG